jgi:hypothetical protein
MPTKTRAPRAQGKTAAECSNEARAAAADAIENAIQVLGKYADTINALRKDENNFFHTREQVAIVRIADAMEKLISELNNKE